MAVQTTEEFKNGGATSYAITIEYLKASDIKVRIDGALQTYVASSPGSGQYTVSGTTVTLGAQAASGTGNVHIYRETDVDTAAAVFVAGSSIKAADLNAIHDMARFGLSEARSTTIESDIKDGAVTSAKIKDGTIVNADVNASAAIDGTKISPNFGSQNIVTSGTVDGRDVSADGTKLDGIESGATADQTAAEIKTLIGNASDSNVYTDAEKTKLSGIESGATADQTNAEIKSAYEANSNTNAYTDAEKTKLSGIETAATADQTGAEIKSLYEGEGNTNAFTDAEKTKLSNIETSATADQTGAEIKAAYEAESNTNAFTDAEKTKLGNLGSLNALSDVNTSGVADGKILKYDASASEFIIADDGGSGSGGATTFTGLTDTPANYGSAANKTLKVNSAGDAIEFVTVSTDIVNDTTPQLGGNLDVQASEITTSTTNGNIKLNPNGTGVVEVKGDGSSADGTLQLNCSQNSHGVKIKSPAHSASANYTLTLPSSISNGGLLQTDTNGNLSWQTNYVPSTGGSFTGPIYAFGGIELGSNDTIKFDSDDQDANHISFRGPNSLSSTVTYTLPEDGTAGQFLKTDGSGVLSFGTVTTDLVGDTSPQLGGQLDTNGNDIVISDGQKLSLDTHAEVRTKTGATNAVSGGLTGYVLQDSLVLDSDNDIWLRTPGNKITFGTSDGLTNEVMRVQCSAVGASQHGFVNLNYVTANAGGSASSSTKLQTTSTGVTVTGTVAATSYTGDGSNLTGIASTVAGGAIYENSQTISASHTIPVGSNGMSAGPVTVNNGVTLTISNGSTYTIV